MDYSLYIGINGKKEERKKELYKFKFTGESKGGQNNKVLEKLWNQEKGVP